MTTGFGTDAWSVELLQAALAASAYEAEKEEASVPPAETLAALGERVTASTSEVRRRDFVLWPHLARGTVSATFAPGGLGKSTLALAEAVAIASGYGLLGTAPDECARVLYLSGEDEFAVLQSRLAALLTHYGLAEEDANDRLHLQMAGDRPLAWDKGGVEFDETRLDAIADFVRAHNIGLVIVDTLRHFCSANLSVPEVARQVVKRFARLAVHGNCAVELIHHTVKLHGREITIDDMGGAADLAAAVRSARGLQPMADSDAALWGVSPTEQDLFVRVKVLKSNIGPKGSRFWFRLAPVRLAGGTEVHTAEPWTPPNLYEEVSAEDTRRVQHAIACGRGADGEPWRANIQTGEAWAGHAAAEALKLSLKNAADRNRIRFLLKTWIESGALVIVQRPIGAGGKRVPVVEVGARV